MVEPGPCAVVQTSGCGVQDLKFSLPMDLNKNVGDDEDPLEFEEWEPSEGSFISHMVRWSTFLVAPF